MAAVASAVPELLVDNASLGRRLGVDDHWILKRTGVRERRIATTETAAGLAAQAGRDALFGAGMDPADIDLVLVATMTPDAITPTVASEVVGHLGCPSGVGGFDVNGACTGWLGAVSLAAAQIETGRIRAALVVGADLLSRITNPDDRATACLFGDGAGAVVLAACEGESRIGPVTAGTDPEGARLIYGDFSEGFLRMKGGATFGAAVARLAAATIDAVEAVGARLEDIDLFVYHQANGRILRSVAERLQLPWERLVVSVDRYGNTSAASIPMALALAAQEGRLRAGSRALLAAFASGFTWASVVVDWGAADPNGHC
jgi:3-oxoacyl-[acyl-carrier-protein] synthase-3